MKIGLEFEIPLVTKDGEAARYADNQRLWKAFHKKGWIYKRDPLNHKVIGCTKKLADGYYEVGTDYGTCAFEVALPPIEGIREAEKQWKRFKNNYLLPAGKESGLRFLAYAAQPKTKDLRDCVAPKSHYAVWNAHLSGSREVVQHITRHWPGLCAAQYNLDVTYEDALTAVNTFLALSGFQWVVSADSPIAAGEILPYRSLRGQLYRILNRAPITRRRLNLPVKPFRNISDYLLQSWRRPLFEIIRQGRVWYRRDAPITAEQFFQKKKAVFLDLEGNREQFEIETHDLTLASYFYFMDCRFKFSFDENARPEEVVRAVRRGDPRSVFEERGSKVFIEVRPTGMGSDKDNFSWLAFDVGILSNLAEAARYVKDWKFSEIRALKQQAQKKGLHTTWHSRPFSVMGARVLALSKKGLCKIDPTLISYLGPLEDRLARKSSPADDAISLFKQKGINGFIDAITMH